MNRRQLGYFSRQTALLLALLGLVLAFAVPKLNDFSDRNKLTEAYHLASESKLRVSEFYKLSARFPTTETELKSVTTSVFNQPEFVSAVIVEHKDQEYDVVVKVYLKEDVIDNDTGDDQFLYIAATRSDGPGMRLEWSCGISGVDSDLLPRGCTS